MTSGGNPKSLILRVLDISVVGVAYLLNDSKVSMWTPKIFGTHTVRSSAYQTR